MLVVSSRTIKSISSCFGSNPVSVGIVKVAKSIWCCSATVGLVCSTEKSHSTLTHICDVDGAIIGVHCALQLKEHGYRVLKNVVNT